jgi:hypothetical protein
MNDKEKLFEVLSIFTDDARQGKNNSIIAAGKRYVFDANNELVKIQVFVRNRGMGHPVYRTVGEA